MPFLSQVAIYLSGIDGHLTLESTREEFLLMIKMFLSSFHKTRLIDAEGNLTTTTRYISKENRFFFRCADRTDVIIRRDSFAYLTKEPEGFEDEDDVQSYYELWTIMLMPLKEC